MVQTCWNVLKPHMHTWNTYSVLYFYQTRDRSLGMLVSNSRTKSWLVNLIDRPWCVKMPTQNLLRLLLLLMLVMRIVLATVSCTYGSWGLGKKLNFCSDFEHKVWSRFEVEVKASLKLVFGQFFSWCFVEVMKLNLGWDSEARFGEYFEI